MNSGPSHRPLRAMVPSDGGDCGRSLLEDAVACQGCPGPEAGVNRESQAFAAAGEDSLQLNDGGKRKKGSKIHVEVNPLRHLLALHVTPASTEDRGRSHGSPAPSCRGWVVEHSFAWATRFRRLVKDYEGYAERSRSSSSPLPAL